MPTPIVRSAVVALQFLVGALVTFGGFAYAFFAVNPFGVELGWVHFAVGLGGLLGGFLLFKVSIQRLSLFLIAINSVTIAYSLLSEGLAEAYALLEGPDLLASLVGTAIAVLMSASIIYLVSFKVKRTSGISQVIN